MHPYFNKFIRYSLLFPGIFAVYLLIGTVIAFALSPFKVDITSESLIGNVLLMFLIPTKMTNELFNSIVPLSGIFLLLAWFTSLFVIIFFCVYLFKKRL